MSLNKQIQQILQKESIKFATKHQQNNFILKKLNISFLYYLLTECNNYSFVVPIIKDVKSTFISIDKIIRDNEIIYDFNSLSFCINSANFSNCIFLLFFSSCSFPMDANVFVKELMSKII